MQLAVEWERPLPLRKGSKQELIYAADLDRVERVAGVYVFARRWGRSYEALYVGRTNNLRARLKIHLNSLRLMRHLENAKTGKRVFMAGYPVTRPGQRLPRVLAVLERALIRHFLAEGHDLVNKQGVRIRRHEIRSSGGVPKSFVPALMYLEQTRKG